MTNSQYSKLRAKAHNHKTLFFRRVLFIRNQQRLVIEKNRLCFFE